MKNKPEFGNFHHTNKRDYFLQELFEVPTYRLRKLPVLLSWANCRRPPETMQTTVGGGGEGGPGESRASVIIVKGKYW